MGTMKFTSPKGTRDFYPEDMALQNRLFSVWRETALLFGFEEYEGPIFEHLEVFTAKSGEEIVKQLYAFKDKSDRDLALRPEITPTLARMAAARGHALKKPVKWFSLPRLFRYERMQRGRLREFFQYNLDILGEPSVTAEAEIIAASVRVLRGLGLSDTDVRVCVNSRKLMKAILESLGVTGDRLDKAYAVLDRRLKVESPVLAAMYQENGFSEAEAASIEDVFSLSTLDALKGRFAGRPDVDEALRELDEFFGLTRDYGLGDAVVFDPSIVRGLAYYTGIVWEIYDTAKTLRAIAGGGRYDNLVALMGGEPTPAVGFGMGDAVISELLRERGLVPPYRKAIQVYVVNFDRNALSPAVAACTALRSAGVAADYALKRANVKRQMEAAQEARLVLFVGGDEWVRGEVKVRDMASGDEKCLAKEAFFSDLKRLGPTFLSDLFASTPFKGG